MSCIMLSSVACPALPFFPHVLINGKNFGKQSLNTKCVFWFFLQHLPRTRFFIIRTERGMVKHMYWSSSRVPVILVRYEYNLDRGSTVVKVLCYKSEGRWFDPSWCHWIFY